MRLLARTVQRACRRPVGLPAAVQAVGYRSLSTTVRRNNAPSFFSPKDLSKPFFATTPIFYVNASPHIGHLHSLVLTDVLARYSKLRQPTRDVVFTTGTDEHGLKIQQAAAKEGMEEEEFCARVSQRFRDLADQASVEYTDFIRTSEQRHYKAVEHFWAKLVAAGDVYKGTHSGWYSVSDECFYSQGQVAKDEKTGEMVAIETGNPVVWEEEENWKFKLPKFKNQLLAWANEPQSIYPTTMRKFVASQIQVATDLSISRPRSRVKWGVPVPGDPSQTIYVWVDALINYLTVLGYPSSTIGWPADVHVVGKDIVRFHAIHWPALLMSAGLEPPRRVLTHAHWTMGNFKMSKSRGNVVDPIQALGLYGADSVRWYLMSNGGSLPTDSDYSAQQLHTSHSILASQIGNLVQRIQSPKILRNVATTPEGIASAIQAHPLPEYDALLSQVREQVDKRMEGYEIVRAMSNILRIVNEANQTLSALEPWKMENTTVPVVYAYETLRISGILLQPVMPVKATELLDRLGVDPAQRTWEHAIWNGMGGANVADIAERIAAGVEAFKNKGSLFPRVPDPAKASP